jgi:hypothetical protein
MAVMSSIRISLALVVGLPWLVVGAGCGSASKATGEDGGAGAQQGAAGAGGAAGGAAGGSGAAGSGGHAGGGAGTGGPAGASGQGGHGGATTTLPACPGVDPTPASQACRTAADCPQLFTCGETYRSPGCGACIPLLGGCSGDAGCSADQICVPAPNPCGCNFAGTPSGGTCVPRCTATSCASFETCDMASGLCKPKMCGADFMCPSGRTCAPTRAGADAYGCAIASCSTDGYKCPAGFMCAPGAGADMNGCAPISCVGGGFQCPPNTDCKAGSTAFHQCERRACTSDKGCDCGACVQGTCQDHLFICSPQGAA